jgi:hypothetical protein
LSTVGDAVLGTSPGMTGSWKWWKHTAISSALQESQTNRPSHLILQDEILFLVNNTIPVIPACPESLRCGETDSGQAGMTLRFYFFNLLYV